MWSNRLKKHTWVLIVSVLVLIAFVAYGMYLINNKVCTQQPGPRPPSVNEYVNDLGYGFYREGDLIYQRSVDDTYEIRNIDAASFQFLGWGGGVIYAKDKSNVYFEDYYVDSGVMKVLEGADLSSFTPIYYSEVGDPYGIRQECEFDAQDKNHRYWRGKIVQ